MEIKAINSKFSIQDKILFQEENNLQMAVIVNEYATAIISLYGGQILSYKPHQSEDLLFISKRAYFEQGKAIRGGIPVCFPWFAAHPNNSKLPNHGFARIKNWEVLSTEQLITGETRLLLSLTNDEETQKMWAYSFQCLLEFVIGESLLIKWTIKNTDDQPFSITQALHSYLKIGDINKTTITGLENTPYLETIRSEEPFLGESQPIKIGREIDRLYTNSKNTCIIKDESFNREIILEKSGSQSTVVWNPWAQLSAKIDDLGDEDYLNFICVETANVLHNEVTIEPQEVHSMTLKIAEEDNLASI